MIQIRKNVFETNSSSSHSLVVAPKAYTEIYEYMNPDIPKYMIENGVLYLGQYEGLYFGRAPFRILYTFADKLRYAYANFIYDDSKLKELLEVVQKIHPEIKRISEFENSYEEYQYEDDDRHPFKPSVGTDEAYLESWMDAYNFTLEEFLTNPHYVVIVDGDEYNYFSDMWKLGIVKEELYHKKAWE